MCCNSTLTRLVLARPFVALLGCLLAAGAARAQAPAWSGATPGDASGGSSSVVAVATDAAGNVFVTGTFSGQVAFGSTVLNGLTGHIFVAKWVPATSTWAWAASAGGTGRDNGTAIAVRGNSVYVAGFITNNRANSNNVSFRGAGPGANTLVQAGANPNVNPTTTDLVLAKYVDNGTSATVAWTQVAGGVFDDEAAGLAVGPDDTSVYLTGYIENGTSNGAGVTFGGSGLTAGTIARPGTSSTNARDLVLAKYVDGGTSATVAWTQVAGGRGSDQGLGVAVSGTSVYVAGNVQNNTLNDNAVVLGNGVAQPGVSALVSQDLLLAKYTDQVTSAAFQWSQVAGGNGSDLGYAVAASSAGVYVAGQLSNDRANSQRVLFGRTGSTAGTAAQYGASATLSPDLVLAKYQDNGATGSFGWSQVGGGLGTDNGYGVAVSGAAVYVTGTYYTNAGNGQTVTFGGSGAAAGTTGVPGYGANNGNDLLLARYQDAGPSATLSWVQTAGGSGSDYGFAVAVSGQRVSVGAGVYAPAAFGSYPVTSAGTNTLTRAVATLTDATLPLAAAAAASAAGLALCPNPAPGGLATLGGAAPGTAVQVLDALGRVVATATAGDNGTAPLHGLAPGLYLVRTGTGSLRLAVE